MNDLHATKKCSVKKKKKKEKKVEKIGPSEIVYRCLLECWGWSNTSRVKYVAITSAVELLKARKTTK